LLKILFLIRSLNVGGAERQLVSLANGLRQRGHEVTVAVFYANGLLERELVEAGVSTIALQKASRWDVLQFLMRLVGAVRSAKPQVMYGFLGTPNILTICLKLFFPKIRMIWGVRASDVDLAQYDWLARLSYWIERRLSKFADLIICNSHAGLEYAARNGFPKQKMRVIPNGIDIERFKPDVDARTKVRLQWGVANNEILIGLAARLDPMKDHPTFLQAAAMLAKDRSDVRFVCIGDGVETYKNDLYRLATESGLDGRLIWAGIRSDMPAIYSALDIAVSSSCSEGFSNAIAEAMACGVPCVVTDVGDSAMIVGDCGVVIPSGSPAALYKGIEELMTKIGLDMSNAVRISLVRRFSIEALVDDTVSKIES
jgi:glycosyltransferase involved in cell wall biosynthesis